MDVYSNGDRDQQIVKHSQFMWVIFIFACIVAGGLSMLFPPLVVVGIIGVVVSVVLIFKYPYVGLIMYMAVFLIRPAELWPVFEPLRLERMVGILALIAALFRQKAKHGRLFFPVDLSTKSLLLFWAIMCASWVISYDQEETRVMIEDFLKLIIVYFIVIYEVDTEDKFDIFIASFVLLIAFIAFMSFRDYYGGGRIYRMGIQRAIGRTSAGGDANTLAGTLATTMPLALVLFRLYKNAIIRAALIGIMGLFVVMIINTGSRAGLLTLLVVLGVIIMLSRYRLVSFAVVVAFLFAGSVFLPEQYRERYLTIFDSESETDDISSGRIAIWENGIRMFLESPIYGVGGSFKGANASGDFGPPMKMQAHSLYIQLLACYGLVGTAVWFMFLLSMIRRQLKARPPNTYVDPGADSQLHERNQWYDLMRQAMFACIVGLLIVGIFGHSLDRYTWYFLAALTVAIGRIYSVSLASKESDELEQDQPALAG